MPTQHATFTTLDEQRTPHSALGRGSVFDGIAAMEALERERDSVGRRAAALALRMNMTSARSTGRLECLCENAELGEALLEKLMLYQRKTAELSVLLTTVLSEIRR